MSLNLKLAWEQHWALPEVDFEPLHKAFKGKSAFES